MINIFRYPGGKSKKSIREKILKFKPDNFKTYVEPFVGGGGIFFGLEKEECDLKWINDIDENLTDLNQVLKQNNNNKTIYKLWYGDQNKSDKYAAERISNIKGVYIKPVKSKQHVVVRSVIKSGEFKKEMDTFFGEL